MRFTHVPVLALALMVAAVVTVVEAGRNAGAWQATIAVRALASGEPVAAMRAATAALRWDPYQEPAQFTQIAAFKRLGMWDRLESTIARVRPWHPDQTLLRQLAGEAAWHRGDHAAAAENLWAALWRTPYPPQTPAQVWRIAMTSARQAWGAGDPRVAAAAVRVLSLLDQDVTMGNPAIRAQAVQDAAETLRAAGAPLTAQAAGEYSRP